MKAKSPFGALEVRGKFGNIAVGSVTRRIQVIKKKSDPTNPRSSAQTGTRNIYGQGVEAWEQIDFTVRDKTSLRSLARLFKFRLNAWQIYYMGYAEARAYFPTYAFVHDVHTVSNPAGELDITCKFPTGYNLGVALSTKFNLPNTWYGTTELGATGNYQVHITNLIPGQKYYFIFAWEVTPYSPAWWEKVILWQDDFNDGNFNGWTVIAGVWTAVPLYLKGTSDHGKIITDTKVVPAGTKYITFKHRHHGTGSGNYTSKAEVIFKDDNDKIMLVYHSVDAVNQRYMVITFTGGVWKLKHLNSKYNYFNEVGNWFNIKLYKSGLVGKFKIWKEGEAEPGAWDWEGNWDSGSVDNEKMRMWSHFVAGEGMNIDDIEIYRMVYHPEIQREIWICSGVYSESIRTP